MFDTLTIIFEAIEQQNNPQDTVKIMLDLYNGINITPIHSANLLGDIIREYADTKGLKIKEREYEL